LFNKALVTSWFALSFNEFELFSLIYSMTIADNFPLVFFFGGQNLSGENTLSALALAVI